MFKKNKNLKKVENIHLSGSPKDQASQLLDIIKERQLGLDELNAIFPKNIEVIKEFTSCMKSEMAANQTAFVETKQFLEKSLDIIDGIIKDGKIDDEERKICIQEIRDINQNMIDLQKEHERNHYAFWKDMSTKILAFLAFIAVLVAGGKGKNRI